MKCELTEEGVVELAPELLKLVTGGIKSTGGTKTNLHCGSNQSCVQNVDCNIVRPIVVKPGEVVV